MEFVKEFLLKPFVSMFGVASGAIGLLAFVVFPQNADIWLKLTFALAVVFFVLFVSATMIAHRYHQRILGDGRVKSVRAGDYYYTGSLIVILDKAKWLSSGCLVTLYIDKDEMRLPIALMRVDTINSEGYGQCVVLYYFGDSDMSEYVLESGRWKSMAAQPIIMYKHVEDFANV
ncbi:hypothetical protein [Pseudomonas shahriarae]|uniref:hypothetical protein n=1 Tax=Pseudomonas shahriarae TaxID=2745512 RepID=UPI002360F2AC|nr:hypothetical protein [Pseudomonas shahriarae]MDD1133180.1 hypothetical protein [Pseudomonas shahriarae]